ncbi:hypothetical protein [Ancylobacter sp. TS-1]|nr:hypothetical protein [Ancylobacter sp. TS-1]
MISIKRAHDAAPCWPAADAMLPMPGAWRALCGFLVKPGHGELAGEA